jgi:hypothetical protein
MSPDSILLMVCACVLMLPYKTADAAENPMACVEEITMPYVTSGMVMSIPANIQIHVLIGSNGVAQKIDYSSGAPVLKHELDFYFKDGTRYSKRCKGKTISFLVQYLVEGNETIRPVSEVRFRPPNEFIVRSHPVTPVIDIRPDPK